MPLLDPCIFAYVRDPGAGEDPLFAQHPRCLSLTAMAFVSPEKYVTVALRAQ